VTLGSSRVTTGVPAFVITFVNLSNRPVILESAWIELTDNRILGFIVDPVFVGAMGVHEKREHRFVTSKVVEWLRKAGFTRSILLKFCVQDSTEKQHTCKYKFDPGPWNPMSSVSPAITP